MTAAPAQTKTDPTRAERTEQALFSGDRLTLSNPRYRETVRIELDLLLTSDAKPRDLTVAALGLPSTRVAADITTRQPGVAAGLEEFQFLLGESELNVQLVVKDGAHFNPGQVLAHIDGDQTRLLAVERVALNLIQRMCGIATAAHTLKMRAAQINRDVRIVGTRKTPCGLLDKRALDLGGVGTHRISLADAILIKNNHLALVAATEIEALPIALERAWEFRAESRFIEVEVRSLPGAIVAARKFSELLERSDRRYPCLLMLDNFSPSEISAAIEELRAKNLHQQILIEASGGVGELNFDAYATSGADAVSVGALTHSSIALDIALRIS